MPAPPDESEPAMVSAIGVVIVGLAGIQGVASGSCSVLARRVIASKFPNAILSLTLSETTAMVPFFVQFKCKLGQSYAVANALAEAEIASEIYSTAGDYDLLVKFYVDNDTDIGHFVNEKVQVIPGIQDTHTIITFKAFGTG
jgi:DNA-binding Lrp family transcriptional regulator